MIQIIKFTLAFILCFYINTVSQNPEWIQYTNGDRIHDIEVEGENIWLLTDYELVKINSLSGNTIFFDKADLGIFEAGYMSIDPFGNKWIVSFSGHLLDYDKLIKFDGVNWTKYDSTNSVLSESVIPNCITSDNSGNIWIGTRSNGLIKFNGTTWTVYDTTNSEIQSNIISFIKVDRYGNVWLAFGAFGGTPGLSTFDGNNFTDLTSINSYVHDIEFDDLDKIWMATSNGLIHFNGVDWTTFNTSNSGISGDDVRHLEIDSTGNIWLGTEREISKFDGNNWWIYNDVNSDLPNSWIRDLAIDNVGNLLVGMNWGGMIMFDQTKWTTFNTSKSGFPRSPIMAFDNNNMKWFVTRDGLVRFDGTTWTFYDHSMGSIKDIVIDNYDNKWILTSGALHKFDGITWSVYNSNNSGLPKHNGSNCLAVDNSSNIYIGLSIYGIMENPRGLVKFNGTDWKYFNSFPYNHVYLIEIDDDGNKWMKTIGDGLYKLHADDSTWTNYNATNSEMSSNNILDLDLDVFNNLWITSRKEGYLMIEKFDGNNWASYIDVVGVDGYPYLSLTDIDNFGNIWVAQEYGLRVFDGNSWRGYNKDNTDIPFEYYVSIEIDNYNNKWIVSEGPYGRVVLFVFNENGVVSVKNETNHSDRKPNDFLLYQNYPNPFNPITTIKYSIPKQSNVTLKVFDLLGSEIVTLVNNERSQGNYEIEFDGKGLTSGLYFYRLQVYTPGRAGDFVETKKMILLK